MPEEMGLLLTLDAQLKSGAAERIKRDIEKGLGSLGIKTKTPSGAPDQTKDVAANLTKGLKGFGGGGIFGGGLKGILGMGAGAGLGAAGGMAVFEGMKGGIMKLYELMRQSSPIFQRSLKMIHMGILSMIRPFADTLGRIMYPISRFFMIWARELYKDYRAKYKEYVGQGMSPIEASIKASAEAFTSGIINLFTGKINLTTIGEEIMKGVVKSLEDPQTFLALLGIGALIVGAVAIALVVAAPFFAGAMITIAGMIGAAGTSGAVLGLAGISGTFAALGVLAGGLIGGAIRLGLAALPLAITAAVVFAGDWLYDEVTKMMGWTQPPPGGPGPAPGIPGGMPGAPLWPWDPGFKWPWEGAVGGIVTRPTFGLIGEAGPEAVIPLSKMSGLGGASPTINLYVSNCKFGEEVDFRRVIRDELDDYIRCFERGR